MPAKLLLPLRFLSPSLPVARTMTNGLSFSASRAMPVFPSIFPFKLKYLVLNGQIGVRRLSTRPFRPRAGSSSEFTRSRSSGGGDARGGSKSLIDDEAELSDWVGELKESNFDSDRQPPSRFGNRDGDRGNKFGRQPVNSERGNRQPINRDRDVDRGNKFGRQPYNGERDRERVNKFDRQSVAVKRRRDRESDSDGFAEPKRITQNSRMGQRFGEKFDGGNDSRRRTNFRENSNDFKGKRSLGSTKRELVVDSEDDISDFSGDEEKKGLRSGIDDLLSEDDEESSDLDFSNDDDIVLRKKANAALGLEKGVKVRTSTEEPTNYLSQTRFDQFPLSPLSLKGIKDAGYQTMTVVQAATLPVILKGKDVMAKAKTGTGKTVAFLLPSIEVVVKTPPVGHDQKRPPILVLVICPTRELATQAATEAKTLLKYHSSIGVQVVIGGTRLALEQKRMQANPCQILVATPGRLRDHTENTAGFASRLMGVKVLVLDEADHLLDMGFRKDIEKIIAAVPKQRQTLLFSATIPDEVRQISHIALKRDHDYVNTVEEGSEETHAQVRQMHLVAPLDNHFPLLYALLKEHIADDVNYKVLVFCTTAKVTGLVADLLGELSMNVREIHSRKPQGYRTRVSDEFRKSKGLILVTSDVSARGVDYPDVTLVIQIGVPSDRQQYIHRLGRTGRKGKEGQGILMLAPWEEYFLSTVKDLPISKAPLPTLDPDTKKKVAKALSNVDMKSKEGAYQAWLGYYNSNKKIAKDKIKLVELANEFSRSMGLDNPPAIAKLVLGKMGLRNVPGLRSK